MTADSDPLAILKTARAIAGSSERASAAVAVTPSDEHVIDMALTLATPITRPSVPTVHARFLGERLSPGATISSALDFSNASSHTDESLTCAIGHSGTWSVSQLTRRGQLNRPRLTATCRGECSVLTAASGPCRLAIERARTGLGGASATRRPCSLVAASAHLTTTRRRPARDFRAPPLPCRGRQWHYSPSVADHLP